MELLLQHLTIAQRLNQDICRLQLMLRNVSFVDLRELFHRIGVATAQCSDFLNERIRDMAAATPFKSLPTQALRQHQERPDTELDFAAGIERISHHTRALMGFAAQAKSLMDQAVINGDYNALHVMTDCVYQTSQLVALIQIHLPVDSPSLESPAATLHIGVG